MNEEVEGPNRWFWSVIWLPDWSISSSERL